MSTIPAYPLTWPTGWKRTPTSARTTARFSKKERQSQTHRRADGSSYQSTWARSKELTINDAVSRVRAELERMGVQDGDLVISSNLQLRLDGFPRSGQAEPADPGVAVYWVTRAADAPKCMAIDRYDRVADNLAAVAATLEAMRAIERHGGAEILNRAYAGFTALPGPASEDWRSVLDPGDPEGSYKRLRAKHHPDRGGDGDAFQRVQRAFEAWKREQHG